MSKVSVILTAYNGEKYICEAIDSVLSQTYKDFEIIVIDDGSTDSTATKLKEYGDDIKYIYQNNSGTANALNKGIKNSIGDYIAFIDQDDVWISNKIEKQINYFQLNENVEIVGTNAYLIDSFGDKKNELMHFLQGNIVNVTFKDIFLQNRIIKSSVMCCKKSIEKIGLFDTELRSYTYDYYAWLVLSNDKNIKILNEPLIKYRWHDAQTVKNEEIMYEFSIKALKKIENNFPDKFRSFRQEAKKKFGTFYFMLTCHKFKNKNRHNILNSIMNSILYYPYGLKKWILLFSLLLPVKIQELLRQKILLLYEKN